VSSTPPVSTETLALTLVGKTLEDAMYSAFAMDLTVIVRAEGRHTWPAPTHYAEGRVQLFADAKGIVFKVLCE